ncbi:unnamed protein product, partial [Brenthis ino]
MDAGKFINLLESQFKINFKSLPQWKELIELINISQTDYKRKLQNAEYRRAAIIQKLYIQYYRLSPFELTDNLLRRANLWKELKSNIKKHKINSLDNLVPVPIQDISNAMSEEANVSSNAHPNTEVIQSKDQIDLNPEIELEIKSNSSPCLPIIVYTNEHKIISPIGSHYTVLNLKDVKSIEKSLAESSKENIFANNETKFLKCSPNTLMIRDNIFQEQTLKFSITNCATEYSHIRFKCISDNSYFKNFTIVPNIPVKLNPGLTISYKFIFALQQNLKEEVINSKLYFRTGRNVLSHRGEEILSIPIVSEFQNMKSVTVSKTVYIPSVYSWQVTGVYKYPKGVLQIDINDEMTYNVYIRKKDVDIAQEISRSLDSLKVAASLDTESLQDKENDNDFESRSKILSTPKRTTNAFSDINNEGDSLITVDVVTLVLIDIVNLVLEPFVFKNTYLRLFPKSKRLAIVYLTKAEHVGYHHSYYDLIFVNPENDETVFIKTIKVFAEILPHPILIQPPILDMTKSPVKFGFCKDHFTISNTHKIFPVTIKINTTSKMKNIFKITPMETLVSPKSKVNFEIRMCVNDNNVLNNIDDFAYFTFKIAIIGHDSIYSNVPPFFYEIIAPYDTEFMKLYGKKYYRDMLTSSQDNIIPRY